MHAPVLFLFSWPCCRASEMQMRQRCPQSGNCIPLENSANHCQPNMYEQWPPPAARAGRTPSDPAAAAALLLRVPATALRLPAVAVRLGWGGALVVGVRAARVAAPAAGGQQRQGEQSYGCRLQRQLCSRPKHNSPCRYCMKGQTSRAPQQQGSTAGLRTAAREAQQARPRHPPAPLHAAPRPAAIASAPRRLPLPLVLPAAAVSSSGRGSSANEAPHHKPGGAG